MTEYALELLTSVWLLIEPYLGYFFSGLMVLFVLFSKPEGLGLIVKIIVGIIWPAILIVSSWAGAAAALIYFGATDSVMYVCMGFVFLISIFLPQLTFGYAMDVLEKTGLSKASWCQKPYVWLMYYLLLIFLHTPKDPPEKMQTKPKQT